MLNSAFMGLKDQLSTMTLLDSAFMGLMEQLPINHDIVWFRLYGLKGLAIYLVPPSGLLYDTVTIISQDGGGRVEGETSSWDSCFFDSIIFINANFSENNMHPEEQGRRFHDCSHFPRFHC